MGRYDDVTLFDEDGPVKSLKVGDAVCYKKRKVSDRPTAKAIDLQPTAGGDDYHYKVNKYWTVTSICGEDKIEVVTRRGKKHIIDVHDPCLRKVRLLERLLFRYQFPSIN